MEPFAPRTIIAGFDFSDCATAAVETANEFAQRWSGRVIVVHAAPDPPLDALTLAPAVVSFDFDRQRQELQDQANLWMKEIFPPEWLPETRVLDLPPAEALLRTAKLEHADLIVMGTEGRGGLSRLTLGSVAEQVLRQSPIPVLTVRISADGSYPFRRIRRILCPVNFSGVAGAALAHALPIAEKFGAELTVLHLIESRDAGDLDEERERLKLWVGPARLSRLRLRVLIRTGDAGAQILEYARRKRVDLIVHGAQHRRFRDTTAFGSTTERVSRHAPCPVLTIMHKVANPVQTRKEYAVTV